MVCRLLASTTLRTILGTKTLQVGFRLIVSDLVGRIRFKNLDYFLFDEGSKIPYMYF